MACGSGGGATCSQPPFRRAVQFEHALTSKETCGSTLTLGTTESQGFFCLSIYIVQIFFQISTARFCFVVISDVLSLHYDLNKQKYNYSSLNFC